MGIYTEAVQKLYVAYFSRPADAAGLVYWEGVVTAAKGSTAAVSAAFAASAEYKASFAGLTEYQIVNTVYMNLFGRPAEPAGLEFWGQALIAKKITIDAVVTAVAGGAQGTDLVAYNSKVAAATAFTAALDTSAEILGYSGPAANGLAATFIAGVTDAATLAAAIAPAALAATVVAVTNTPVPGITSTLTLSVDDFVGTSGNDTINAFDADGNLALGTFDTVNGGGGTDTISFVDTNADGKNTVLTIPTTATVGGIESVNVTTVNGVNVDTTVWTGVNKLTVKAAGAAAVAATVSNTTDVTIQTAANGAGVTVAGGKSVTIAASNAGAGDVSVTGTALSAVKIAGGANVTVDNTGGSPVATSKGTTLAAVSIDGTTGGTIAVKGAGLTTLNLSNLAQTVTATVSNATAAHALNLNLEATEALTVVDAIATSVNVATTEGAEDSALTLTAAKATTFNLSGDGALALTSAGNTKLTSINGAAATGGLTITGLSAIVTSVTTGSGDDDVTITTATVKDDTTTTANEAVGATVSTGAGDDIVELAVTGTGKVTVDAGDGDDEVHLTSRTGTEVLAISLGGGSDTLTAAVGQSINGTDIIDAGAGTDTLTLNLVGAANIGAFAGFELFDAINLNKTLDVDILASKNTVTEIIASGTVGAATLENIGAGVGFRATADMAGSMLLLKQKTAGAITVTADMDETTAADDAIDVAAASVSLFNATSANIVFGTDFKATRATETLVGDNVVTLSVVGTAATAATVTSGGTLANNVLNYDANSKLAAMTVTGAQKLNLTVTNVSKLASIDASAHTGGLTVSTASVADLGTIKLGSGVDVVTVAASSTSATFESLSGFEKTSSAAVGADATAATAAIADADTMVLAGATVANAKTVAGSYVLNDKGVLSFSGAGPATLAAAFALADDAADAAGEALVFNYLGDSYVFVDGGTAVKLVGVTGITNLAENGVTDSFFIV